jgi:hypothetical protein
MTRTRQRSLHPALAPLILLAALACAGALAAGTAATADPQARYQREGGACYAIKSFDERAECLSEAGLHLANSLPTPAIEMPQALARNALRRCEPLPEPDRKDCMARMQGQGTTTGSVAAGGIYRQLVTREVVEPEAKVLEPVAPVAPAAVPAPAK